MKKYILSFALISTLSAAEYTGKIEPFESFSIKSQTSGLIEKVDFKNLTYASNNEIISIEQDLEKNKLKNLKDKLKTIKKIYQLKKENVNNYKSLNTVSNTNKNDKTIDLLNLESSIYDIENTINDLEFNIQKKNISLSNKNIFIKDVKVYPGEVIQQGQVLMNVENHENSKIIFYVNKKDLTKVKNKEFEISIDNEELKFDTINIDKSTDSTYVSSYKVEIIVNKVLDFGKIVKIVVKD